LLKFWLLIAAKGCEMGAGERDRLLAWSRQARKTVSLWSQSSAFIFVDIASGL
jgi:hypothetical protein